MCRLLVPSLLLSLFFVGCASGRVVVPQAAADEPELTLVWVGRGKTEVLTDGNWVRAPQFDYDFSVEQRRYKDRWESVKSLRRRHPDYDGSAGDRTLTWFFSLDYQQTVNGSVPFQVVSSLGSGSGTTDAEFRRGTIELKAPVSSMAPFDRYRITQTYFYDEGRLEEVIELNKGDKPWARNFEQATLFAKRTFDSPPTQRK